MEIIMRYFRALVVIAFTVVIGAGAASAAGYDRYDLKSSNQTHSKAAKQNFGDGWSSLKKAAYLDKIPSAIDEVAFFIRDFLGQFGLKLKRPH
jgi:hypothetical protein